MKKFLSVLLSAVLLFTMCFAANAQDTDVPSEGTTENKPVIGENVILYRDIFYITIKNKEFVIVAVNLDFSTAAGIGLIKNFGTYTLGEIGDYAFVGADMYPDLQIPETVHTIGKGAFENTDIKTVELYANVKSIGENAFAGCEIEKVMFLGTEKQFENIQIAQGNEALFENIEFASKVWVMDRMFAEYGPRVLEGIALLIVSPIAILAAPIATAVFAPAGIVALGAPFIAAYNLIRLFVEFFEILFTCMFEI